jgi:hypothetical protein
MGLTLASMLGNPVYQETATVTDALFQDALVQRLVVSFVPLRSHTSFKREIPLVS